MIDFLWHLRGSVALQAGGQSEAALERLEGLLKKQYKPTAERSPNSLTFYAPLWRNPFAPNWLVMTIYDQGRFWVENGAGKSDLRYDLRSLHGFIFCLFGAMIFFLIGLTNGGLLQGLCIGAVVFGWLYGTNLLLAFARVPRIIRKTVRPI
jgi:hypothetical protein